MEKVVVQNLQISYEHGCTKRDALQIYLKKKTKTKTKKANLTQLSESEN